MYLSQQKFTIKVRSKNVFAPSLFPSREWQRNYVVGLTSFVSGYKTSFKGWVSGANHVSLLCPLQLTVTKSIEIPRNVNFSLFN